MLVVNPVLFFEMLESPLPSLVPPALELCPRHLTDHQLAKFILNSVLIQCKELIAACQPDTIVWLHTMISTIPCQILFLLLLQYPGYILQYIYTYTQDTDTYAHICFQIPCEESGNSQRRIWELSANHS